MEFLIDTANLEGIQFFSQAFPLAGVTTNPSILKKEGKVSFFEHMKKIRSIIGSERTLHVQVVATDYEGMLRDAEALLTNVGSDVYVKVPITEAGLQAVRYLVSRGVHVTATAIYTKMQAYLAIEAGVDYLAPYYNRMMNQNIDPDEAIYQMAQAIERSGAKAKILGASFKNVAQVNSALEQGAQAVTVAPEIFHSALGLVTLEEAVNGFRKDWESVYGEGVSVATL